MAKVTQGLIRTRYLKSLGAFSRKYAPKIRKILKKYIVKSASLYLDNPNTDYQAVFNEQKKEIQAVLTELYQEGILRFSKQDNIILKEKNSHIKDIIYKQLSLDDAIIASWIENSVLKEASLITLTQKDIITKVIKNGIVDGNSKTEIADSISQKTSRTFSDSERISRTETHNVATYASDQNARQIAKDFGIPITKTWIQVDRESKRPDHAAVSGTTIQMSESFNVAGKNMTRPADPAGGADQIINCQCFLVYEEA